MNGITQIVGFDFVQFLHTTIPKNLLNFDKV